MNWEHIANCCQLLPTVANMWVWVKTGTSRNPRYFGGFTMVPGLWPSAKPRTDPRDPRCGCEAQPFALNGWIRSTSSISKRWNGMRSQVKRHIWILKGYGSKLGTGQKSANAKFDGNMWIWWRESDPYPSMDCAFRMSPPSDKISTTPTSSFKQLSLISLHSDRVIIANMCCQHPFHNLFNSGSAQSESRPSLSFFGARFESWDTMMTQCNLISPVFPWCFPFLGVSRCCANSPHGFPGAEEVPRRDPSEKQEPHTVMWENK